MLSNLLSLYANGHDYGRALAAIDRILIIHPKSASHTRDRGLLLAALGDLTGAIDGLRRYLALAPNAPDADNINKQITSLLQQQAKLN